MNTVYLEAGNRWSEYSELVKGLVQQHGARKICDVGGGANPVLPAAYVQAHNLDCTILDVSMEELAKAPAGYQKLVQDIEAHDFALRDCFDFVVTKMLAEHIRHGQLFHQNLYALLEPGGIAVHYFPTLYALPFVANRLAPQWLSSLLLEIFSPRERYRQGKFPAYYSWCYGPTQPMLMMLHKVGFEILEYRGLIGHTYFDRVPVVRELHRAFSRFLVRHPTPYLTSFAQVILRKPVRA